jgi:hypothetical protein
VTFTTKAEAREHATKLAKKLNENYGVKNSFKAHYWENLGWHSSARSENLNVWESPSGGFTCLLGTEGSGCGIWNSGGGSNPITAIRRAIDNATICVTRYLNIVNGAVHQTGRVLDLETEIE